MTGES